jgi:hypothetical protein
MGCGQQHRRHLVPGGSLSVGSAGADGVDGMPGGAGGQRSPGQESHDQRTHNRSLDPVEGAPERVAVRPQPANGPRDPCRYYQLLPPRLLHHHELVRHGVHMLVGV